MPENLHLVTELAIILIAAGTFTLISKWLKQPLILGYIVAGLLVGPKLGLFPQFSTDAIHQWSELGIIFLLFGLGLEFSFKKLIKIGSSALITAGVNCVGMFLTGILLGRFMGWSTMEGIFLGGMMSMSSTTIIIKAYEDLGLKKKPYASLIFGALVFEDLIAVLLMVLLSTLAVTGRFAGMEMLNGILKLAFFLILWFVVGIYILPSILNKVRKNLTDEILLLVSVGLCFFMVILANYAGFSSALGAFVMGSLLSETLEGHRIENLTSKIKDLFGAIFFVSVGMMVDPAIILMHWQPILIITIGTLTGILIFSTAGALLAGQGLNTSVHAGFTLAQLGEFSFIIAGLGCSLGVLRDFIYPVIIAVSVITTFTTPYMIKMGTPAALWLQRKLPKSVLDKIDPPQTSFKKKSKAESNVWKRLLRSYFMRVVLYGVICVAIVIGCDTYLDNYLTIISPEIDETNKFLEVIFTLLILSPFLFGLASSGKTVSQCSKILLEKNPNNRWPILAMILFKTLIATVFVTYVIDHQYAMSWWTLILIAVAVGIFIMSSRNSVHRFSVLENTFLTNLNEKEDLEKQSTPVTTTVNQELSDYNITIEAVTISPDFNYAGMTLRQMPFRKGSGINIIKIQRGSKSVLVPSGNEIIYPGDRLLAVGTPEQLENFVRIIDSNTTKVQDQDKEEFTVKAIQLDKKSSLTGQKLETTKMRAAGCMVVNVLRDGKIIPNPSADFVFAEGDTVWVAGEKSSVEWYL